MDFEQWFDKIAAQGRFTRQQCRDIARESWTAALAQARAEERKTIESIITETLQFQSCMCLKRSLNAIRARSTP